MSVVARFLNENKTCSYASQISSELAEVGRMFCSFKKDESQLIDWLQERYKMNSEQATQFAKVWAKEVNGYEKEVDGIDWNLKVYSINKYNDGVDLMKKLLRWQLITGNSSAKYLIFDLAQVLKHDYVRDYKLDYCSLMYSKQVDPYYTEEGVLWNYGFADIDVMAKRMTEYINHGNWAYGFCELLHGNEDEDDDDDEDNDDE